MWKSICWTLAVVGALPAERLAAVGPPAAPLVNGGFESGVAHEGWTLHVYGAKPKVTLDTAVRHEGHQSLRVEAEAPSDTAFGQEIQLMPGRRYRLRGWVRTENLDPPGRAGLRNLPDPVSRRQRHDHHRPQPSRHVRLTEEVLDFTPPGDGRTRIAIFFVGWGLGTGTAWFDQLAVEEVPEIRHNTIY